MTKPFYLTVGIDPAAVGPVIERLKKTKGVVQLDLGAAAPKKQKMNGADDGTRTHRGTYTTTGREAIAAILKGKPPMTTGQLRDAFEAQGRSPASIASCVHTMKADGELVLTDSGYTLTKKMRDRLRHRKGK